MDNLCHSLSGLALGEAGLKRRTAFGTAALVVSSNLPDVDVLVFLTSTPSVAFRRGWTHGVLAQALLPVLLTAAFVAFDRYRARMRGRPLSVEPAAMLALCYIGVLSHVALDFLNNYGIRLLKPLSERWFYGDAVFIIDPWLWVMLATGIALARWRRSVTPARVALAAATAYIAGMLWIAAASRQAVLDAWTMAHGEPPPALMVGPVPAHPFRKTIIVDAGSHYETGTFHWWPRSVRVDPRTIPKNGDSPAVRRARMDPRVEAVLVWARFPYYVIERDGHEVWVRLADVRFGERVGTVRVNVAEE